MQFVYKPDGADPKKWEFAPDRLMNAEAEAIERHTGMTFGKWSEAIQESSMLAIHGLLFVMLKRTLPTLKWDEVQFKMADVDFELDDDESAEALANLEEAVTQRTLNPAEAQLLVQLRESAPAAPVEPADPDADPNV